MASKMRKVRKEKNLNLYEAAEICGVTPQYLSELERGIKDNPSAKMLSKIIKVYDDESILDDFLKD
jgi:transcriptional regulator with XRE-family HTH domain